MRDLRSRFFLDRTWPWIIAGTVIALAGIQIFRVNAPLPERSEEEKFHATTGRVLEGSYSVPAGDFLAVRMDLNHRVKLTGRFATPDRRSRIGCLVLSAENLENWKSGRQYKRLAETGMIPGGRIDLVIEPGTYFIVLDNRGSSEDRTVEAFFTVD